MTELQRLTLDAMRAAAALSTALLKVGEHREPQTVIDAAQLVDNGGSVEIRLNLTDGGIQLVGIDDYMTVRTLAKLTPGEQSLRGVN